jgi:translocation and assembly module TamB
MTLIVLVLAVFGIAQSGFGKHVILAQLESNVSDPPARLHASALEGLVPFDMQLVDVSLSDEKGIWLQADRLALSWSPTALLGKRLRIDDLTAGRIAVLRTPVSPPSQGESAPLEFPHLPVDIDLRRLQVDRLELATEFLGEPAVFTLGAQAKLGDPAAGLQSSLHLKRTDRDNDTADLDLDYRPEADSLKIAVTATEPQGGLIAKMLALPGKPNFTLSIAGEGPLDHWQAKGNATADNQPILNLAASSTGAAKDRTVAFDLALPNLPMLPSEVAPLVQGGVTANGTVHLSSGPIKIGTLKLATAAGTISVSGDIDPSGPLNLKLDTHLATSAAFQSLLPPELGWSAIAANIQITGTTTVPKLALEGTVDDLAYVGNSIGRTSLSLYGTLHTDSMRAEGVTASIGANAIPGSSLCWPRDCTSILLERWTSRAPSPPIN